MSKIKSFFKRVDPADRSTFDTSRCLTTISVGQQTHERGYLKSYIQLINNSFSECVLLIDDTLQRHNMALNRKEEADYFREIALREGDLWLSRNQLVLNELSIPLTVYRWDKWLQHPNFSSKLNEIKALLESDASYHQAFDDSITEFLNKYLKRLRNPEKFNYARAYRLSFDFVLEECAALALWSGLECQFEVYPNRHNSAIEETRRRFVTDKRPDLLRAVTIGFRSSEQLKPQTFDTLNEFDLEMLS